MPPLDMRITRLFADLLADETGATAIEYALIAALIAVAAIAAFTLVGTKPKYLVQHHRRPVVRADSRAAARARVRFGAVPSSHLGRPGFSSTISDLAVRWCLLFRGCWWCRRTWLFYPRRDL